MKKTILSLAILASAVSLAGPYEDALQRFETTEAGYNKLLQMEETQFNALKASAATAESNLTRYQAVKASIEEKISKIESMKKSKFYTKEYSDLEAGYRQTVKSVDAEIDKLNKTLSDYEKISALKGGN